MSSRKLILCLKEECLTFSDLTDSEVFDKNPLELRGVMVTSKRVKVPTMLF
jgi:hypothetical protein